MVAMATAFKESQNVYQKFIFGMKANFYAKFEANLRTSTYHQSKRRGDKFDQSMTRGKLLGNNAQLFIFISILIMIQLISFLHFLLSAVRKGRLGVLPIKIYRGNNAVFVSVDLIGEKNQVILE